MSTANEESEPCHDPEPGIVQWRNGTTPISTRFDDTYFSESDGRAETREVFLTGNGLPQRWQDTLCFTIAELGFGTGLNFCETAAQWQTTAKTGSSLRYVSFELNPLNARDMAQALAPWPDLSPQRHTLLSRWPAKPETQTIDLGGGLTLDLRIGDARTAMPNINFRADAWYLDGFSPAKNPELWDVDLMKAVCDRTMPGGTFSTYTAAGWVRRNLEAAGFTVRRVPGFDRKRERLQGTKPF